MVKKMKLPFLFMKSTETTTPSWPWPTCGTPKTLSFRASGQNHVLKTINDTTLDSSSSAVMGNSEEAMLLEGEDSVEKVVIRGLRSERLVFEPGETSSSSILDLQEVKDTDDDDDDDDDDDNDDDDDGGGGLIGRFKESVVMAVLDSTDPFVDFRRSMQEMVEAHQGLNKDWECLEELLTCYLRVNGKSNHGYIVGAFVDLLVGLALSSSSASSDDDQYSYCYCSSSSSSSYSSSCTTTNSFTSPLSFSSCSTFSTTSPCLSILEVDDEIQKSIDHNNISSSSSSNICSN